MTKPAGFVPHGVVFTSSMAVMIVELIASRLVSKYLGNSLYTWTAVIGIVLGGISLGNWIGGRIADRHRPRDVIPVVLLAASVLTVLIVALDILVGWIARSMESSGITMGILLRSVILITVLFFAPSCAMGMVPPVMAKHALEASGGVEPRPRGGVEPRPGGGVEPRPGGGVGKTVGGIYAAGALGSIAGTFLCGYLLIPFLGLTANVLIVGAALAALSLLMGGRRIVSGIWLAAVIALLVSGTPEALTRLLSEGPGKKTVYFKDSPYSYIEVSDQISDGAIVERDLRLDALIHNRVDPDLPDHLLYEYEGMFAAVTREVAAERSGRFQTLTLGGGAFTLPSFLQRAYPDAVNEVAEIDPDVVETAHRFFGLPRGTEVGIELGDARAYVSRVLGKKLYDIVYCDVFNAFSIPAHLTTMEFDRMVAGLLSPNGVYLINLIDILDSGRFLNACLNTARAVFPEVSVYWPVFSSRTERTTFVIIAGSRTFREDILEDAEDMAEGSLVPAHALSELAARNGRTLLTDDYAPVENLMAPVFRKAVR